MNEQVGALRGSVLRKSGIELLGDIPWGLSAVSGDLVVSMWFVDMVCVQG